MELLDFRGDYEEAFLYVDDEESSWGPRLHCVNIVCVYSAGRPGVHRVEHTCSRLFDEHCQKRVVGDRKHNDKANVEDKRCDLFQPSKLVSSWVNDALSNA